MGLHTQERSQAREYLEVLGYVNAQACVSVLLIAKALYSTHTARCRVTRTDLETVCDEGKARGQIAFNC
jgi:hypothetical protein